MKVYKDTVETAWAINKYRLKGRKGTRIYREERDNHIKGMVRVTKDGEFPLEKIEYLVFDIPHPIDKKVFRDTFINLWNWGLQVRKTEQGTEVSMHYPQVFHSGLICRLVELGYVRQTWKEIDKEPSGYSLYVNARGWHIFYNLCSLSFYGMKQLWKRSVKKHESCR